MMRVPPFFPEPSALIVRGINALLRREPWAARRLADHAGKSVRLSLTESAVFQVSIGSDGLLQPCDAAIVADVALSIPAGRQRDLWPAWRRSGMSGIVGLVHIQGDAGLAQLVSGLASDLRWDAEEDLSRLVGDVAALRLMAGARHFATGFHQSAERLRGNLSEYLGEESGLLLQRESFRPWKASLRQLQDRLDTLDARVRESGGQAPGAHASGVYASGVYASGGRAPGVHASGAYASGVRTSDGHVPGAPAPGTSAPGARVSGTR